MNRSGQSDNSLMELLPPPVDGEAQVASVVLHLEALNPGSLLPATGQKVHGFWHAHWGAVDPATAGLLHDSDGPSAFCLSPVMGLPPHSNGSIPILEGQTAWFRIVSLDPALTEQLFDEQKGWLSTLPEVIPLGPVDWRATFHPFSDVDCVWSCVSSYQALARAARPAAGWVLNLDTPTSFSGRYMDFTFPLPDLLVRSWLERWNRFSPLPPLPETLVDEARDNLRVSRYRLGTQPGERRTIGCCGSLTIRAYDLPSQVRMDLDLLFHYAFFCGTGHRTAQGMGQTRLIRHLKGK